MMPPSMKISPGVKLGPYEIVSAIGAGGMGEVYKAVDTRLERTVAVKVVSGMLDATSDARDRFEREARTISRLNHPNICALYDVGRQDQTEYIVLEYLEGQALSDRLAKGPLPPAEAIGIATQICAALDAAHRAGIVHRDLKPANVVLTRSSQGGVQAKLLDFGLAKQARGAVEVSPVTLAATAATPLTAQGTILGTFQYMAPEQIEGQEADARSDIWALGCVLHEMLTGVRPFDGKSQANLMAAILERESPSVSVVQPHLPRALDGVVQTCLAKDPGARFQSAHDVAIALRLAQSASSSAMAVPVRPRRSRGLAAAPWVVAAVGLAAAAGAWLWPARPARAPQPVEFDVHLTAPQSLRAQTHSPAMAVAPDGSRIAYVARTGTGDQLYVRELHRVEAVPLGVSGDVKSPFFSPDGRWVGVFHAGVLKKVPVDGGAPIAVCSAPSGHGGAWNAAGTIVFSSSHNSALSRVSDQGGEPEPLTALQAAEIGHYWPTFLDDQTVLFTATISLAYDNARIDAVRLDTKSRQTIVERAYGAHLLGDDLLFTRGGVIMRARLDRTRLATTGDAVPAVRDVRIDLMGPPELAVARSGLLAYVPGRLFSPHQRLVTVDRAGAITEVPGVPQSSFADAPVFAPDGRRIAYSVGLDESDIWIHDLDRRVFTRITSGGVNRYPAWSPDGKTIAYSTNDAAGRSRIVLAAASGEGTPREIANRLTIYTGMSFAPDGQSIVFAEYEPRRTMFDTWRLPVTGGPAQPLLVTPAFEYEAQLHPNGRWLAYVSTESGPGEVYVRSIDDGAKWRISTQGGAMPVWSRDGRELFYRVGRKLMVVAVSDGATFRAGDARQLFDLPGQRYDVASGGTRFVSIKESISPPSTSIRVIANWQPALK